MPGCCVALRKSSHLPDTPHPAPGTAGPGATVDNDSAVGMVMVVMVMAVEGMVTMAADTY